MTLEEIRFTKALVDCAREIHKVEAKHAAVISRWHRMAGRARNIPTYAVCSVIEPPVEIMVTCGHAATTALTTTPTNRPSVLPSTSSR